MSTIRTTSPRVCAFPRPFFCEEADFSPLPARHAFEKALQHYQHLRHQHTARQHKVQHDKQVKTALPPIFTRCNELRALEKRHGLDETPFPSAFPFPSSPFALSCADLLFSSSTAAKELGLNEAEYHKHLSKLENARRRELEAARKAYNPHDPASVKRLREAEERHGDVTAHIQQHGEGTSFPLSAIPFDVSTRSRNLLSPLNRPPSRTRRRHGRSRLYREREANSGFGSCVSFFYSHSLSKSIDLFLPHRSRRRRSRCTCCSSRTRSRSSRVAGASS
jgi:hypothetical protein